MATVANVIYTEWLDIAGLLNITTILGIICNGVLFLSVTVVEI